ncbi:MAG: hypothetical protein PHY16_16555 [Methylobacter sp.]|nr:hypothetical protein [Methylobacter sp.]
MQKLHEETSASYGSNTLFVESDESINIFNTINTDAGCSDTPSAFTSAFDENAELEKKPKGKKKPKKPDIKDSKLAEILAESQKNNLAFDEISSDWYRSEKGLWKPISSTRALKLIDKELHERMPQGFCMSKLKSIEGFYGFIWPWTSGRQIAICCR